MPKKYNNIKYEELTSVPADAETVSGFQRKNRDEYKSAAYVHVKFNRWKHGYTDTKGVKKHGPYPGYEIKSFKGVLYVIADQN